MRTVSDTRREISRKITKQSNCEANGRPGTPLCYLCDERVVGHHHGDGPEESLEVVGKLRSTGVAGVHGDEGGARHHQPDLLALKHEPCQLNGTDDK